MAYKDIASQSPYNDLYDESKNYYRLLFVPERALQSRELIELATTSQDQLTKFAEQIYETGSAVNGSAINVNFNKDYVIVESTDAEGNTVDVNNFLNEKIIGQTTGSTARVTHVNSEHNSLYFEQLGGDFSLSPVEEIVTDSSPSYNATLKSEGQALFASIDTGIVFVADHFVRISDQQEIIVDYLNTTGNYYIGFTIDEKVVDYTEDSDLLDPANDAPNYNAPGADRYKLTVQLHSLDAGTSPLPDDFYKLMEVNDGEILQYQDDVQYSGVGDTLARRRYEESGNYVVEHFPIKFLEHPTDNSLVRIGIESGLAYIFGYRIETDNTRYIDINKARTYDFENNENIYIDFGPSVDINSFTGAMLEIDKNEYVDFYSNADGGGSNLGTARLIALVPNNVGGLRAHFAQAEDVTPIFDSVRSFVGQTSGATANVTLEDDGLPELHDRDDHEMVYHLGKKAVRDVVTSETIYDAVRNYYGVTQNASNEYVLTSNDNDITFYTSTQGGIVSIIDGDTGNYISSGDYSASYGVDDTELIITLSVSPLPSSIDIIARINKNQIDPRTKTHNSTSETIISDSEGVVILNNTDIFRFNNVLDNSTSPPTEIDQSTITLDNGQRDYVYDYGRVEELNASTEYVIEYEYFGHDDNTKSDYFAANSYPSTYYDKIPIYKGKNNDYLLRDALDFRISIDELSVGRDIPYMKDFVLADFNYYLPRKDIVFVDKNGNFDVKEGVPSLFPNKPNSKDQAEVLYDLDIPPYTFMPKEIDVTDNQNKNYTMLEIGDIDSRLKSLEYYVSLNQLEQESNDKTILDRNGTEKSKQGILTDDFSGHAVSDINHPDYNCSIDKNEQILRPPHTKNHFDFIADPNATHSNVIEHKHIVTLDYSLKELIKQPYATESISVTPLVTGIYNGSLTLEPRTDNWIDTETQPDAEVNLGGRNNNWELLNESISNMGSFETQWNDWQTINTGRDFRTTTREFNDVVPNRGDVGSDWVQEWGTERVTTTTRTEEQQRTGQRITNVSSDQISRRIGERVTDISVVPFMRSRNVSFTAVGLKPETEVRAYFDSEDVTEYCAPSGGAQGDPLIVDSTGTLVGTFTIPNNDTTRFRVGTKTFELKDRQDNPSSFTTARYTARGLIQRKQGTVFSTTVPDISTETRTEEREFTSRSTDVDRTREGVTGVYNDPVAQTFMVDTEGGVFLKKASLYFESKPDPTNGGKQTPVRIRIVDTINGYPSDKTIPFSEVSKNPSEIAVSDDSSIVTEFEFEDPIFLEQGREYAIVILSNSTEYRIWTSVRGEQDIQSNTIIAGQPYMGSFFKSQNNSTWSAEQDRDIKFLVHNCEFISSTGEFYMANEEINDVYYASTMMLDVEEMEHEETGVDYYYRFRDYESANVWREYENKKNIFFDEERAIEDISGSDKPVQLKATLNTNNTSISPVVDKERRSFVAVRNKITDMGSYYDAGAYVSRRASLINPSDDMKVYLNVSKPGNSDIRVYFNTGTYLPRYALVDQYYQDYIDQKVHLYWHRGTASTPNNEFIYKGSAIVTRTMTESSVSPTEERVFLKSISNADAFADPSTLLDYSDIYMVLDDAKIDKEIVDSWNSSYSYSSNEHVWYNGSLWRSEVNNNTGNEPSSSSVIWTEVLYSNIQDEIQKYTNRFWQEMEVVDSPDEKSDPSDFYEYGFKPIEVIGDEFTNYRIKIEMRSQNKVDMPKIQAMRVIAAL